MPIPAIYINLESRPDRRSAMEAELARVGLAATRLRAVTVTDVSGGRHEERLERPGMSLRISAQELACSISHRAAIRKAFSDPAVEAALIMEDDVVLADQLPAFLDNLQLAGTRWDVLRLETHSFRMRVGTRVDAGDLPAAIYQIRGYDYGAAAYLVSRCGAAKILARPVSLGIPHDDLLFNPVVKTYRSLERLQAVPALAIQRHRLADSLTVNAPDSDIQTGRNSNNVRDSDMRRPLPKSKLAREFLRPVTRLEAFLLRQLQRKHEDQGPTMDLPFLGASAARPPETHAPLAEPGRPATL